MSSALNGKKILAVIRYVVGYIERYIKNSLSQIKWTWKQSKWAYSEYVRLHTHHIGSAPHKSLKILAGGLIAIFATILLKILLLLMIFKSI